VNIGSLSQFLQKKAPYGLAMQWDNVGVQIGLPEWPVTNVLLSLDLTPSIAKYAIDNGYDTIVTHHPLLMQGIKQINNPLWISLIEHHIGVISLHTNLDVIPGGVNTVLASLLGLQNQLWLSSETGSETKKIVVNVPIESLPAMQQAVWEAGAGKIGNYDQCGSYYSVEGHFRSQPGSNPTVGNIDQATTLQEARFECVVDDIFLSQTLKAIRKSHPYETPAIEVINLSNPSINYGLGVTGDLAVSMSLREFGVVVKDKLQVPMLPIWPANKEIESQVTKVAVCGGAGGSLLKQAASLADVIVTSDIKYHSVLESQIPIIDAGHYHSEYPVLRILRDWMLQEIKKVDIIPFLIHDINKMYYL